MNQEGIHCHSSHCKNKRVLLLEANEVKSHFSVGDSSRAHGLDFLWRERQYYIWNISGGGPWHWGGNNHSAMKDNRGDTGRAAADQNNYISLDDLFADFDNNGGFNYQEDAEF